MCAPERTVDFNNSKANNPRLWQIWKNKAKKRAWERCAEHRVWGGGRWLRKRREGGKDHGGVKFLCNMSPCLLPHGRLCLVRCTGVRCVQLLFKLCLWTKKGEKREKEKWKTSQWRQYWRVFCLSPWHSRDCCQDLDCGPRQCHVSHRWAF